jgi:hypothetical protein
VVPLSFFPIPIPLSFGLSLCLRGGIVNRLLAHAGVKEVHDLVSLPSFDFEVGNSGAQVLRKNQLYLHLLDKSQPIKVIDL